MSVERIQLNVDKPYLGILLIVAFCVLAPLGDGIAKLLSGTIPLGQLLLIRFAAQAVLLVPILWWTGRSIRVTSRVLRLTILRTILHIIGIGALFTALRYLPLADALAIAFVMPFIMLLLGRMVLKEEVGPRRLIACAVGFIGTLLVIQPSFAEVGAPALLPLVVALVFALFMLITRQIAKEVEPVTLQAVSGVVATAGLLPVVLVGWSLGLPMLDFVTPSFGDGLLLAAIGVIGTLAHLLMTWALRFAPSATLAPMQYLEIPFATIIGWILFNDLPNGLAAVGIAITMAAGLYVVFRERANAQIVPAET
jgi:drug/metabolite transporter (DMT)-like permease